MTTVGEVCDFLNEFAPLNLAESWDNVGLLIGRSDRIVSRIMTCLTLTPDIATEAIASKTNLIVSHHPVLFRGTKRLSDATIEGDMLLKLIETGIAVYSPHTAFDSAREGINQQIANALGLQDVRPLNYFSPESPDGSGRWGVLPEVISIQELLDRVRQTLGAKHLEYCGNGREHVRQLAIGCGAAESFLSEAIANHCDTFITGEARFHTVLEARSKGVNLILTGHYHSERPAVETLAKKIAAAFPVLEVFASMQECNPLSLWTGNDP
ncbi:MAG: Nif3-like dinuclear metal center hexameric protein [Planctomycetaceae bacterium]